MSSIDGAMINLHNFIRTRFNHGISRVRSGKSKLLLTQLTKKLIILLLIIQLLTIRSNNNNNNYNNNNNKKLQNFSSPTTGLQKPFVTQFDESNNYK